jgi:3-hydroxybutyryl-CoA dehydratase
MRTSPVLFHITRNGPPTVTAPPTAGTVTSVRRTFTQKDIRAFHAVTDDKRHHGAHATLAESNIHGKQVVPSLLVTSLFDIIIANELPVRGATVIGQMLKFPLRVHVGETVTASVEIISVQEDRYLMQVTLHASTTRGLCVDGEAVLSFGPRPSAA